MLKVLYLPLGSQTGTCDAWKNIGVNLEVYDYWTAWSNCKNKDKIFSDFLNIVRTFKPQLIHTQLQFTGLFNAEVIGKARALSPGVIITNWSGDVRHIAQPEFTSIANALDYNFISSTGQLELYRQAGCKNMFYWQIGYDPKCAYPTFKKDNFKYDISFLANNYGSTFPDGQLRLNAANYLRNNLGSKFGLFGVGHASARRTSSQEENNNIYNDSLCVLSISNFNNIDHYFSDRLLLCMASGRPTISWHFPKYEDYFTDKKDIFIARSNEDILNILNFCKNNPDIANEVGINGYKKVYAEHSFTSRIIELLTIVKLIHLV